MSEKMIFIDEVGDVSFKHSNRARHLNITVKPFLGARVSIPIGMSYKSALRLVTEKKLWLKQHIVKMKELEKQQTNWDENSGYCTKSHKLFIKKSDRDTISVRLSKGKINVIYPAELQINSIKVQTAIRTGIERALKIEAKVCLPERVKILAEHHHFDYNKLTLKNIKSRWGSCSRINNINLSIHLMRLPQHLIDYVILHELAHTIHHNHSNRFWDLLDKVTGGAKPLDKELGKHRISIY